MQTVYLSCAETAKIVRRALKFAFPDVKFSVRSDTYSGGASIDIKYTDGPPVKMVKRVVQAYEGASFDGMIDLKSYHDKEWQGKPTHFGADFIFPTRRYTAPFLAWCSVTVAQKYGVEPLEVIDDGEWEARLDSTNDRNMSSNGRAEYLSWLIMECAEHTDARTYQTYDRHDI